MTKLNFNPFNRHQAEVHHLDGKGISVMFRNHSSGNIERREGHYQFANMERFALTTNYGGTPKPNDYIDYCSVMEVVEVCCPEPPYPSITRKAILEGLRGMVKQSNSEKEKAHLVDAIDAIQKTMP